MVTELNPPKHAEMWILNAKERQVSRKQPKYIRKHADQQKIRHDLLDIIETIQWKKIDDIKEKREP